MVPVDPADGAVEPRRFDGRSYGAADLVAAKAGRTVSVCLPARDEAATVGTIVGAIRRLLVDEVPLVDELIVIDDHSTDATAEQAAAAGAEVISAAEVLGAVVAGPGKGEALWRSLHASSGDLVVWCDADLVDFDPAFITGLLGPLLCEPIDFVKGYYERPEDDGVGGGRVTELVARPALSLLHPRASGFLQPLSGEYGGRRELLESLPFTRGYGVDLALLLDALDRVGPSRVGQVDLGRRHHRNRSLDQLAPQAAAVLQVALRRTDDGSAIPDRAVLRRADGSLVTVEGAELPPLIRVAALH